MTDRIPFFRIKLRGLANVMSREIAEVGQGCDKWAANSAGSQREVYGAIRERLQMIRPPTDG